MIVFIAIMVTLFIMIGAFMFLDYFDEKRYQRMLEKGRAENAAAREASKKDAAQ